jgi:hypothetical protein
VVSRSGVVGCSLLHCVCVIYFDSMVHVSSLLLIWILSVLSVLFVCIIIYYNECCRLGWLVVCCVLLLFCCECVSEVFVCVKVCVGVRERDCVR